MIIVRNGSVARIGMMYDIQHAVTMTATPEGMVWLGDNWTVKAYPDKGHNVTHSAFLWM